MVLEKCTLEDVEQLTIMNKQLIEDEKSDNPMSIEELQERMLGLLSTEYQAYFFIVDKNIVGYALVKHTVNPYYLRQFFIKREYRRKHYGMEAFQCLLQKLTVQEIDIEVLPWNEQGMKFWHSCGFQEISRYLRYSEK